MLRLLTLALCLAGCATVNTQLPPVSAAVLEAEQARLEQAAFQTETEKFTQLYRVALPILRANAELCDKTRPSLGVVTHDVKAYPKTRRDAARTLFGAGDEPTVRFVMPGSPAEQAGLKPGDVLQIDGEAVSAGDKDLAARLEAGKPVDIVRDGLSLSVTVTPTEICDYPVTLRMSAAINAYANGKAISVTGGMLDFVRSDDELAAIIGHELAHNTQNHIRKSITNALLTGYQKRYIRPFEAEADYVGLYYAVRAGYDIDGVEDMWRRLAHISPTYIAKQGIHPSYAARFVQLGATREEIHRKQNAGELLVPTPRKPAS